MLAMQREGDELGKNRESDIFLEEKNCEGLEFFAIKMERLRLFL